jgi:hypothetical protein
VSVPIKIALERNRPVIVRLVEQSGAKLLSAGNIEVSDVPCKGDICTFEADFSKACDGAGLMVRLESGNSVHFKGVNGSAMRLKASPGNAMQRFTIESDVPIGTVSNKIQLTLTPGNQDTLVDLPTLSVLANYQSQNVDIIWYSEDNSTSSQPEAVEFDDVRMLTSLAADNDKLAHTAPTLPVCEFLLKIPDNAINAVDCTVTGIQKDAFVLTRKIDKSETQTGSLYNKTTRLEILPQYVEIPATRLLETNFIATLEIKALGNFMLNSGEKRTRTVSIPLKVNAIIQIPETLIPEKTVDP